MITKGDANAGAVFSDDERYRYKLWRRWNSALPRANFLMLNPSKATHEIMDPTVTRTCNFAKAWGFGALDVTNIFALRSTDPEELYKYGIASVGGGANNDAIIEVARKAGIVVCAWSQHGKYLGRGATVRTLLVGVRIYYLRMGKGKNPQPHHPLYLPSTLQPTEWL